MLGGALFGGAFQQRAAVLDGIKTELFGTSLQRKRLSPARTLFFDTK